MAGGESGIGQIGQIGWIGWGRGLPAVPTVLPLVGMAEEGRGGISGAKLVPGIWAKGCHIVDFGAIPVIFRKDVGLWRIP
jgi:hypothetical protein